MIKAYLTLWNWLTTSGMVKPTTHLLDNKASEEFKVELRENCTIQLVPPDNHQQNLAEQAIQTHKNHFNAILAGVDDSFPMRLWDKLLPQTILTLNLLCQSTVAPTVSTDPLTTIKWHSLQLDVQFKYTKVVSDCPRPIGPTYALGHWTLEKEKKKKKKKCCEFLIIENYNLKDLYVCQMCANTYSSYV